MYTKEIAVVTDGWAIFDPDGDFICTVLYEGCADALLSHLNRGL